MYSRYTPNASGGFDRRQIPDEADLRAVQGRAPPDPVILSAQKDLLRGEAENPSPNPVILSEAKNPSPLPPNPRPMRFRPRPRPPQPPEPGFPGPPPPPILGGLLGPEGLLGQLLPRGLDSEDLLILAILLLSMKQDGATPTELLIAVGLYLWL